MAASVCIVGDGRLAASASPRSEGIALAESPRTEAATPWPSHAPRPLCRAPHSQPLMDWIADPP